MKNLRSIKHNQIYVGLFSWDYPFKWYLSEIFTCRRPRNVLPVILLDRTSTCPKRVGTLTDKNFQSVLLYKSDELIFSKLALKGTGTRDLIWLKVVSLDRSWLVGLIRTTFKHF
jgi:hypothetical protein